MIGRHRVAVGKMSTCSYEEEIDPYYTQEFWSDDSDWDSEVVGQTISQFASMGDGGGRSSIVRPHKRYNVLRNQVIFACKFGIEPRMQRYYYTQDLLSTGSRPMLYGSPEFDGGLKTKWQVLIDLNRWEGTKRWVSLYLSRLDGDREPDSNSGSSLFQCEFRVVNSEGKVVKALRNQFMSSKPKDTNGFSRFLPFADVLRMISGNSLRVEAHMTVVRTWEMGDPDILRYKRIRSEVVDRYRTDSSDTIDCSDDSDGYQFEKSASTVKLFEQEKYCFTFPILDHKKVEFFLDDVLIGFADRNKLLRVSDAYRNWCGSRNTVKFRTKEGNPRSLCTNRMTIHQYLQFVEKGFAIVLSQGTIEDIRQIIGFAENMGTVDLIRVSIKAMCSRKNLNEAVTAALHLRNFSDLVDEDYLEHFRNNFRKNLNKIVKTDVAAKKLIGKESEYFVALLLDPDPEYNLNNVSSDAE